MDIFLIIGRDGGLELSNEEFASILQQAAEQCPCPKCTAERAKGDPAPGTPIIWADVDVDTYRPQGTGGFSLYTSAVRLRHRPTGINVVSETERSAHANKEKAWKELQELVNQFYARRAELKSMVTPAEQTGKAVNLEIEEDLHLAPDQFAFVDTEAGTAYFENISEADSRVRAELVKRGWTPPGEGVSIQYPDVMRSTGTSTEGTAPTAYRNGWNACRVATMTLNRADRNGNRS